MTGPPAHGTSISGQTPVSPEIGLPLEEYIEGIQHRANHGIEEYLEAEAPPSDLRLMLEHALGGEGPKRLRPALAYIVGDTLGAPREDIDGLAVAVEIIHSASLAMDDLPGQDNSSLRRGQEALHEIFGVGQTETAVVAMVAKTGKLVMKADAKYNLGSRLGSHIMDLVGDMCVGQIRDLNSAGQPAEETTEEELDEISWLKTGTAVEMSVVGAAMIADPPDVNGIIPILKDYSYHMGIAHQVRDDLWDGTKTSKEIGKPAGIDVRNNKPTYLSVLGEIAAREKASRHGEAALANLDGLPEHYDPVKLREITRYIVRKIDR